MCFTYSDPVVYFGRFFRNELQETLTSPDLKLASSWVTKPLSSVTQNTSFPEDRPPAKELSSIYSWAVLCLTKPKLGNVRVIIQATAFVMVQLFLFEGERSGLAGNRNAGVPVTFQSCLLVFGRILCIIICLRYIWWSIWNCKRAALIKGLFSWNGRCFQ